MVQVAGSRSKLAAQIIARETLNKAARPCTAIPSSIALADAENVIVVQEQAAADSGGNQFAWNR